MSAEQGHVLEPIVFLARSETRVQLLEHLLEAERSRAEVNDSVDASRSTVSRTLSEFEERGWVERQNGTYRLSAVGEIIGTEFLALVDSIQQTEDLSAFLSRFPYREYELNLAALREAEVTVATETEPHAPIRQHAQSVREASRYRALLPGIIMQGKEDIHSRVVNGQLDIEFVVPPRVAETMTDAEFVDTFREQVASGHLSVHVAEATPAFFLGLLDDDLVQIGVSDADGLPRAMLETDHEPVRAWAETVYERHRKDARQPAEEALVSAPGGN